MVPMLHPKRAPHIGHIPRHRTPNIARPPYAAYHRLRMRQSAVVRPAALLEREHEVERVAATLRDAAGGAGGALAIEAPAGMGKSRLLEDARGRAAELGFRVLAARATEPEQGF